MEFDKIKELHKAAAMYRGAVLNEFINLERAIDNYVVNFLSNDENQQINIFVYLLDRITFDGKISALEAMLKTKYSDKNTSFKKSIYGKLIGKIRDIKDLRNFFAHYTLDTHESAIEKWDKEISLLSFRNEVDKKTYTHEKYYELIENIQKLTIAVIEL